MFDPTAHDDLLAAATRVAGQPVALATAEQKAEALRTLGRVRDVLDGALATGLADLAESEAYTDDGAPSAVAWARQHLRLDVRAVRRLVAAGRTMRRLPEVAAAARAGEVRLDHLGVLTAAITRLGERTVAEAEPWLLDVARACEPRELKEVVDALADVVEPERLDAEYAAGMERRDVSLAATTGGYHLSGFLDVGVGSRVDAWLRAASSPRDADDERGPAQRRVDAVDELVTAALEHGLPTDRGVRPQVHVTVEAATLAGDPAAPPAELVGHGPLGPGALSQLLCDAAVRPLTVDGVTGGPTPQPHVLDVGRARRLATPAQRVAVLHRQSWRCATPGCGARHLQVHHVAWWGRDAGPTDLANLVGLCPTCHAHVHLERLTIRPDGHGGWTFTRHAGRPLPDHRRQRRHAVHRRLRALRTALAAPSPPPVRIAGPPPVVRPVRPAPLRT